MKPKTIALISILFIVAMGLFFFLNHAENTVVLQNQLHFFGFEFSVIRGYVVSIFLAAVIPSAIFTYRFFQLSKHLQRFKKQERAGDADRETMQHIDELVHHGAYEQALEKLHKIKQESPATAERKGNILAALGRMEEAVPLATKSFIEHRQAMSGYLLARIYRENGQTSEMLATLNRIIERHPDQAVKAYRMLLDHHDEAGHWETCLDLVDKIEALGETIPKDFRHGYQFAWVSSLDQPRKLIDTCKTILREDDQFVPAHVGLGEAHMELNQIEKAFLAYEAGFKATKHPTFLARLESFYLEQGRPEDAIQVYRQLLVRTETPIVRYQLGKLLFNLEMLEDSLEVLEPLRQTHGNVPEVLFYLAEINSRRGRHDQAHADLREMLSSLGFKKNRYHCGTCTTDHGKWHPRCSHCGHWNTISLALATKDLAPIPNAPIYF